MFLLYAILCCEILCTAEVKFHSAFYDLPLELALTVIECYCNVDYEVKIFHKLLRHFSVHCSYCKVLSIMNSLIMSIREYTLIR